VQARKPFNLIESSKKKENGGAVQGKGQKQGEPLPPQRGEEDQEVQSPEGYSERGNCNEEATQKGSSGVMKANSILGVE